MKFCHNFSIALSRMFYTLLKLKKRNFRVFIFVRAMKHGFSQNQKSGGKFRRENLLLTLILK